jgi:subtilisin family serine protease
MRTKTLLTILAGVALILCVSASFAQPGNGNANIVPGAYIVQVADDADPAAVAAEVARFANGAVGHIYEHALRGFSIHVPEHVRPIELLRQRGVITVEPDLIMYAHAQTLPTGVDRIDGELNVTAKINGVDERVDVDVAIIDTGIDLDHPDLPPVVGGRHFFGFLRVRQDDDYDDDNGHGTHVAGTVAALDNGIGVVGVAPGARLWAVKVLDANGSGYLSAIAAGVDWVTARADMIEVANMSLGGQGSSSALRTAIQNCVIAGVDVVVSAGNSSADIYGPDGVFGTSDDYIPAAYPEAITVSAMADSDGQPGGVGGSTSYGSDDSFATFSNYSGAGAIDLLLPGVNILSTYRGGGYATASGTSMSAPHATGLYALARAGGSFTTVEQDGPQGLAVRNDPDSYWEPIGWAGPLGPTNFPPTVTIISPADGATFNSGALITFTGTATDEDPDLAASLVWTSDKDGQIGTGGTFSKVLNDGTHSITASVTDSGGKTGSASITITVGTPKALIVTVAPRSSSYKIGDTAYIDVTVTDGTNAVASAAVHLVITTASGKRYSGDGTTNSSGVAVFNFKIKKPDGTGNYTVDATASKSGYDSGSGSTMFTVN